MHLKIKSSKNRDDWNDEIFNWYENSRMLVNCLEWLSMHLIREFLNQSYFLMNGFLCHFIVYNIPHQHQAFYYGPPIFLEQYTVNDILHSSFIRVYSCLEYFKLLKKSLPNKGKQQNNVLKFLTSIFTLFAHKKVSLPIFPKLVNSGRVCLEKIRCYMADDDSCR